MSPVRSRPSRPDRLIVEGRDDQWSIMHLMARHGWDWDGQHVPDIQDSDGDLGALESLPVAVVSYRRVGIVLDADTAPDDRWRSVCGRLVGRGFSLPERPDPDGIVVEAGDGRRLGVWLMPDNRSPGKLEDFLGALVPAGDPCWPWAEDSTKRARELGAPFIEGDFIKARIHTWLAWQQEPGQPFGTAIKVATFAHDSEAALKFVGWMERLFGDSPSFPS